MARVARCRMLGRGTLALVCAVTWACGGDAAAPLDDVPRRGVFRWDLELPDEFPTPRVPADNPMTYEKVELGRHLFYDVRLSGNQTFSCASCHEQERAFSDGRVVAVGSTGDLHPRSSMALANVAYQPVLTWANPNMRTLERQALVPMFGQHPVELGLSGRERELLDRLRAEARYAPLFKAAFAGQIDPVTLDNITKALASFQRSLISGRSAYDRFKGGDASAISAAAKRGEAVFFSENAECFHCHGGVLFTGSTDYEGKGFSEQEFFNNGLYNIDGRGAYPPDNPGILEFTQRPEDMGKFKAPSLRNVALTAPYMHDGSIATLEDVVAHYAAGGRTIVSGPYAGNGSLSPLKNNFVKKLDLSAQDRTDLIEFLGSLTDSAFIRDPRHANPWTAVR